jgi:glycosyltransferase involved in cell wall biosynthesis
MNIGILITQFDLANGAELQTKHVAAELATRGHDVTVFTRRFHGRPKTQRQNGYHIRRRWYLPIPMVRMLWDTLPALIDIGRQRPRLDVLLCYQTLNSGFIGAFAQTLLGIPSVVSIRGDNEYRLNDSLKNRLLAPGIYRRASQVLVQSQRILEDMQEQLQSADRSELFDSIKPKLGVVRNGISLSDKVRAKGNEIVFVGRLIKGKGTADLISAAKILPGIEVTIVGDGPERERLQQMAKGLPIRFVGRVDHDEVANYLKRARLLVLPSHAGDGLPNVILEAMSFGLPVISTRTAGIPDVVLHQKTGLLFNPGDVQELAKHIGLLLEDDDLHAKMADQASNMAQSYSWDAVTPQIERVLQAAIESHSSRHQVLQSSNQDGSASDGSALTPVRNTLTTLKD